MNYRRDLRGVAAPALTAAAVLASLACVTVLTSGCERKLVTDEKPRGLIVERVNVEDVTTTTPYADLRVRPTDESLPEYHVQVSLGTKCFYHDYYPDCA